MHNKKSKLLTLFVLVILVLCMVFMIGFVYPYVKQNFMEQKRKQLLRVVQVATSITGQINKDLKKGKIASLALAKKRAQEMLMNIKFGPGERDYVSIIDYSGKSIMHPYVKKLVGKNISNIKDVKGKWFIQEIFTKTKKDGVSYVNFYWQYQNRKDIIAPKITCNMAFKPWNWIIGTGAYYDDVVMKLAAIKVRIILTMTIMTFISVLGAFLVSNILHKQE